MDSPNLPVPVTDAPPLITETEGSQPLRNAKHEAFARARAVLLPLIEAARAAGFTTMTAGNAAKVDRKPAVRARVCYLCGLEEQVIREKRAVIERELSRVAFANFDDFVKVSKRGWPMLDLNKIKTLGEDERRELMSVIKGLRYTEQGPAFELYSKLDAITQLRKLNGLDKPERIDSTTRNLTLEKLIGMSYELARGSAA